MGVVRARPFHHTKWATFFESWVTFRGLSRFKIVKSRESPSGRAFGRGAPSVPPETPHLAVPYPPSLSTRPACRWIYIYRQTDGPCFKWAYLRYLDIYIYNGPWESTIRPSANWPIRRRQASGGRVPPVTRPHFLANWPALLQLGRCSPPMVPRGWPHVDHPHTPSPGASAPWKAGHLAPNPRPLFRQLANPESARRPSDLDGAPPDGSQGVAPC